VSVQLQYTLFIAGSFIADVDTSAIKQLYNTRSARLLGSLP